MGTVHCYVSVSQGTSLQLKILPFNSYVLCLGVWVFMPHVLWSEFNPMENLLLVVKMNYLWKTKHHGFKFRLFIFGVVFTTCLSLQQWHVISFNDQSAVSFLGTIGRGGYLGRDVCFRWMSCPPYQTSPTNRLIYIIFFHVLPRNIQGNDLFFTATPKIRVPSLKLT